MESLRTQNHDQGGQVEEMAVASGIEKILRGVLKYRATLKTNLSKQFQQVSDNPHPTAIFFTCMDSRILTTRVTQAGVGQMFVVRNAGNLIPDSKHVNFDAVTTEPGALELACVQQKIRHVVVCGHSDCKAMNKLYSIKEDVSKRDGTPLELWLKKHGGATVQKFNQWQREAQQGLKKLDFLAEAPKHNISAYIDPENKFSIVDKFSMVNCLQQLEHVASYSFLKEKLKKNEVRLHAMFFDIYSGDMYLFNRSRNRFVEIKEDTLEELLDDADTDLAGRHRLGGTQ